MFEQAFKNIDNVLWKEAGCTTELDYTEQSSWMLFLKYLDDLEQERTMRQNWRGRPMNVSLMNRIDGLTGLLQKKRMASAISSGVISPTRASIYWIASRISSSSPFTVETLNPLWAWTESWVTPSSERTGEWITCVTYYTPRAWLEVDTQILSTGNLFWYQSISTQKIIKP